MLLAAFAGCGRHDASTPALRADATYHTEIFSWLEGHDPSALVVWHVSPDLVRVIAPDAKVNVAGADPCAQARTAHALLLLVASASDRLDRDRAENCGFAIARDGGGIVVAPL